MPARVMQGLFVTAVGEELKKKRKRFHLLLLANTFLSLRLCLHDSVGVKSPAVVSARRVLPLLASQSIRIPLLCVKTSTNVSICQE